MGTRSRDGEREEDETNKKHVEDLMITGVIQR